jgi:hypothetical protein
MKLAEILSGPETWCQGAVRHGDRRCLAGALFKLHGARLGQKYWIAELWRLARIAGVERQEVGKWNDAPGRTWDEVAAVVDAYDRDRMLNP